MTENYKYTDMTSKWIDLANDTYRSYFRGLIWMQERALDLTKTFAGQTQSFQGEGKSLIEDYTTQLQRGQELLNATWQESVKNTVEMVNQYRTTTNANLDEMKAQMDNLQAKVEETTKANIKAASKTLEIAKN